MTDASARLATALADRYRVERELGQGGMATVYLAEDLKHERKVAIKVLHPELSAVIGGERFLSEIKTTASLQHPHILGLIDSGAADGLLYYVMPFIEGETLRSRLVREKLLPVDDAVRLAREVASALEFAHKRGIVHRDIKPENILLQDGQALVADFGIALAVQQAGGSRMTQTGMSLGTPAYMSPEQAMGERDLGARSDVYALGAMTYEMLTGEPPFTGPTSQAIVAKVLTETPPPLHPKRPTVPAGVEAAVLTALQKLPADRFASAAQFSEALLRPGAVPPTASTVQIPAAVPPRQRARSVLPWVLAAVAAGAAAWGWFSRPAPPTPRWQYLSLGDVPAAQQSLPGLAISPDGSNLVYATTAPPAQLWLKRQSELAAKPIPGTDRAIYPVFSPDGKWIAFITDGRLKKVRPDGSSAITLSDSAFSTFGGVAWLDDGTLAYTGPSITQISRVSEAGGASTVVLNDPTLAGFGLGSITPLPGARGVLFAVCSSGCVSMTLHVLDLRTGKHHQLADDAACAWYLPIGRLLYVRRDGTAVLTPFDLDRLEITGPAVPVLEGIYTTLGATQLAWSRTGTLVYRPGTGRSTEFDLVRVDRKGEETPIDSAWHGAFNSFDLAPDGRRAAIGAGLANGALDIWIKQLDRGPLTRLTFSGQDRRPAWSRDGALVAFVRDTQGGSSIFTRRTDGSGTDRLLVRLDRAVQEVEWAPDGRWVVVRTDNGAAGLGDLVGIRTSGDTTPVPLVASPYTELHPALSPDGRWIAYTSNESGVNEVFVRPFPATTSGRWQVSTGGGEQPRWARDGHELYYLNLVDGRFFAAQLRLVPTLDVTERRELFNVGPFTIDPFHQSYSVRPDGGFVFMRSHAGAGSSATQPALVMAEHWFTELESRFVR